MKKRALICGIAGQDGAYLAKLLLGKNYEVFGTSRDAQVSHFSGLHKLGIQEQVKKLSMAPTDFRSVLNVMNKVEPDEVYNLAGQSSVALSFEQPVETVESFSVATLNMLETIRFLGSKVRFYNAGSSECFGDTGGEPVNEESPFRPRSPYAVAKCTAHWTVANYRDAYGLYACTGILFNHESCLRPDRFVTRKIVESARRIANGSAERLTLGRMDIIRDWGWAPEYVEAMWLMMQQKTPGDYIVATGKSVSLECFVEKAFCEFGLDWRNHVETQAALLRPSDISANYADTRKAEIELGWRAQIKVDEVASLMAKGIV